MHDESEDCGDHGSEYVPDGGNNPSDTEESGKMKTVDQPWTGKKGFIDVGGWNGGSTIPPTASLAADGARTKGCIKEHQNKAIQLREIS